jgi:opacity protein-like surface antigen
MNCNMKKVILLLLAAVMMSAPQRVEAGSKWYQNPLGFSPLNLDQGPAFALTGLAVAGVLLFTDKNPELAEKITVYQDAGYSWGYRKHRANAAYSDIGVIFHLRKFMGLGVELTGFNFNYGEEDYPFGGVRLFARWYVRNGSKFRLFIETGAGIVVGPKQFPEPIAEDDRRGTRQNFTPKYGLGMEFNLTPELSLLLGARHVHLSNAGIRGNNRNPGHDSNGFFLGISYSFGKR